MGYRWFDLTRWSEEDRKTLEEVEEDGVISTRSQDGAPVGDDEGGEKEAGVVLTKKKKKKGGKKKKSKASQ